MLEPTGPDDFKKRQEAIRSRIQTAAKSSDSEILKKQAAKENRNRPEIQEMREMCDRLFHEGMEMYATGEMTFEEFAHDLHRSFLALSKRKPEQKRTMPGEKG